ncbi:MAG: immunoglobulin-like domain-containing protein [Holdemanella porci]
MKQNTGDLNSVPTISANDITLNVGDTFDPLANVTATDKEDGTIILTKDNIIANDVDTSKAGTYPVTYQVTDKNGASTEKTITVTVKRKNNK